ncbi:unnamed protein product, partial [marine sediment metagenome]
INNIKIEFVDVDKFNNFLEKKKNIHNENLVSIIIPVYNDEKNIIKAIKSVINQTYFNWELVIVDDCSMDKTYDIVNNFIKGFQKNIILIRNKENMGTYKSINEGLLITDGKFVTVLGSDDIFHERKIENQAMILINDNDNNCKGVLCGISRDNKYCNNVSSLMFRRKIIDEIGYYENARIGCDTELYQRIIKIYGTNSLCNIPKILYIAMKREESLTTSLST